MSFPIVPVLGLRPHGSCRLCAARIEVPGDVYCETCLKKREELRRLEGIHKRIVLESVSGKWFAGEEPDR